MERVHLTDGFPLDNRTNEFMNLLFVILQLLSMINRYFLDSILYFLLIR